MKFKMSAILLALVILAAGLPARQGSALEIITKEDIIHEVVPVSAIVKTADNAILLIDSSASMNKPFKDLEVSRLQALQDALRLRNEIMPQLDINMGLYVYTPWKPLYPVQPYNRQQVAQAIDAMPVQGNGSTFLSRAMENLDPILARLTGRTAVFLVTDGQYSLERHMKRPAVEAKELARKYNVCFYLISTAETKRQEKNLQEIADVNECSRIIPFCLWIERPEYNTNALFVIKSGEKIVTVSRQRIVGLKTDDIHFRFNAQTIDPQYREELDAIGEFVQAHPQTYVVIHGYADSRGNPEYNLKLSHRRAMAVANYLKDHFNLPDNRTVVMWYGDLNPVADNNTEEGRAMNRRVEIGVGGLNKEAP